MTGLQEVERDHIIQALEASHWIVGGRNGAAARLGIQGSSSVIRQIAEFEPRGLGGMLYWYLLIPIHELMFRGMLQRIAATALRLESSSSQTAL